MLKRSIFITILTIALFAFSLPIMAEESATDQAADIHEMALNKTPGDILWHCQVELYGPPNDSDNQILGCEYDGKYIYLTGGGGVAHPDPNKVHIWQRVGDQCQWVCTVDQPTPSGWGWRDIAWDGIYLYASDDRTLDAWRADCGGVTTFPGQSITLNPAQMPDIGVIRAVAYDQDEDWFWTADFSSNIYAFNRAGDMMVGPIANDKAIYGMAYDNRCDGFAVPGPYLWIHVQDSTNVYQWSIATNSYTGVVYSGWGDDDPGVSGIAGGLCVYDPVPSKQGLVGWDVVLLGVTQCSPRDEIYAIQVCEIWDSLYWKPPYPDYAPSGVPDIDQRQDNWLYPLEMNGKAQPKQLQWTFCGPCAVANCFKWFDSKYNQVNPGVPCDGWDMFPLVRDYMDGLPPVWCPPLSPGLQDDHAPENIDHFATVWNPYIGPPPPTSQPFVPGNQFPPQPMPPWGELVERLAWYFDTDGIRTGYCLHAGTNIDTMQAGIDRWLESETFEDGSTLADSLCEVTTKMPTFAYVESLVEKSENVILLLGFWFEDPAGSGEWWRVGGHYVTVAGVNSEYPLIGISDPFIDAAELGLAPGRVGNGWIIPHYYPHLDPTVHNDEGNVSHDVYYILEGSPSPGGLWWIPDYPVWPDLELWMYNFGGYPDFPAPQNVPDEFVDVSRVWDGISYPYTEVEYCVHISPWEYRGDANGDGIVNSADVVWLIDYLFKGGPPPDPLSEGDVNCDGIVNSADVVFLINYLFKGGPPPRCCDP